MEVDPSQVGALVQMALAPIFLLVAIGSFLNVLAQRLGRVVDRTRTLESGLEGGETGEERARHVAELHALARRMTFANRANWLCTTAALLTCFLVALIFIGGLTGMGVRYPVALLFILTMINLVCGLGFFLAEVQVSTRMLHVRAEFLEKPVRSD